MLEGKQDCEGISLAGSLGRCSLIGLDTKDEAVAEALRRRGFREPLEQGSVIPSRLCPSCGPEGRSNEKGGVGLRLRDVLYYHPLIGMI